MFEEGSSQILMYEKLKTSKVSLKFTIAELFK